MGVSIGIIANNGKAAKSKTAQRKVKDKWSTCDQFTYYSFLAAPAWSSYNYIYTVLGKMGYTPIFPIFVPSGAACYNTAKMMFTMSAGSFPGFFI